MDGVKFSIGMFNSDIVEDVEMGFSFLDMGLEILEPVTPQNAFWALEAAIKETKFAIENNIKRYEISAKELINLINSKCSNVKVWCWDGKYYYTDLDTFKGIISEDTLNRIKYIADLHDCDNYAMQFSAYVDAFLLLNNVGIAVGEVFDRNGKLLGYHAWNCVIVKDNNATKAYFFEPQNLALEEVTSCKVDMKYAYYKPFLIIFK